MLIPDNEDSWLNCLRYFSVLYLIVCKNWFRNIVFFSAIGAGEYLSYSYLRLTLKGGSGDLRVELFFYLKVCFPGD